MIMKGSLGHYSLPSWIYSREDWQILGRTIPSKPQPISMNFMFWHCLHWMAMTLPLMKFFEAFTIIPLTVTNFPISSDFKCLRAIGSWLLEICTCQLTGFSSSF